jgi:hypothetical protein
MRKPPVRDPRRKSILYGATYLVPQAGIEPTPRTDIGYRPVSQTRQTRREPLGHHVPRTIGIVHAQTEYHRNDQIWGNNRAISIELFVNKDRIRSLFSQFRYKIQLEKN